MGNIATLRPHADVSIGNSWGTTPMWSQINNSSNSSWIASLGAFPDECEVALQDLTLPVVTGHTPRITRFRIRAVIGLLNDGAKVNIVPYQTTDGYQPHAGIYTGDTPAQAAVLDGLYTAGTYYGPWTYFDKNGDFWTESYITDMNIRALTDGDTKVYDVYCDVEYVWEPSMKRTSPLYDGEVTSIFPTFTWQFDNGGLYVFGVLVPVYGSDPTLGTQTKYHLKVYDDATWTTVGFDYTDPVWEPVADSGIITSSRGRHSFTTVDSETGQLSTPFEHGETYHFVGRLAKSYNGVDWWSDWNECSFVGSNEGIVDVDALPGGVIATSRLNATWTLTGGVSQRAYEARLYEEPTGGFPVGFDPNTTEELPLWTDLVTSEESELSCPIDLWPSTFRIYVRVQERLFGEWTSWDFEEFDVVYSAPLTPAEPTLARASDVSNARVTLTPTWAIGAGLAMDTLYLERSYDNVTFHEFYRGSFGVVYDYAAAFNVPIYYRARVSGSNGSLTHYSTYGYAPTPVTLSLHTIWLKSQNDPSLNARFPVADSWLETTVTKRRTPSHPLGSRLPVVTKDEGSGERGEITFTVQDDQIDELLALIESNDKLILQMPKRQMFVEVSEPYDMRDHLFDLRSGQTDLRQVTMPFMEVAE